MWYSSIILTHWQSHDQLFTHPGSGFTHPFDFIYKPSLIDLVFVSNMHFFSKCCTIHELSNSDHYGLCLTIRHCYISPGSTPHRTVWRYNFANFDLSNDLLCNTDFNEILDPSDIQESWTRFRETFLAVMEQCIPKSVLPQRRNLPWLSKEIIQLIKKRNYYFKKAHSSGNTDDFIKFKEVRNKVVSKLRSGKQSLLKAGAK